MVGNHSNAPSKRLISYKIASDSVCRLLKQSSTQYQASRRVYAALTRQASREPGTLRELQFSLALLALAFLGERYIATVAAQHCGFFFQSTNQPSISCVY